MSHLKLISNFVHVTIWKWRRDSTTYLITSGPASENLDYIFDEAIGMAREWRPISSRRYFNPMFRPIPDGFNLVVAVRNKVFPYGTKSVETAADIFNINVQGVYFLASDGELNYFHSLGL